MKIYLQQLDGQWFLFENPTKENFEKSNITIGVGARIGAWAEIGAWVRIGEGARIGAWVRIGEGARIGERARIGAWAMIGERATINAAIQCLVLGPIGSRGAMLTGYLDKGEIKIGTGCFLGTIEKFEKKVNETHGDNEHGKNYRAAIAFIRERFKK